MSTRLNANQIAQAVYALAESDRPIAPLVREALDVIDHTLDKQGCVQTSTQLVASLLTSP